MYADAALPVLSGGSLYLVTSRRICFLLQGSVEAGASVVGLVTTSPPMPVLVTLAVSLLSVSRVALIHLVLVP